VEIEEAVESARSKSAARLDGRAWGPGERFGRFAVLSVIGEGGMGIVFKGHDPELDRAVAIKLLHPTIASARQQARMRREAEAMAQLQHPNVVAVHEVGVERGQLFIVMDYVEGGTLRGWLHEQERRPGELLEMFIAAGRGLAAAHDAGLIHRDFKPENVLVGGDGRPRIVDFGLARYVDEGDTERSSGSAPTTPAGGALTRGLTFAGEVMGTPAYMSPEQCLGQHVDARSDQFSYCASLHEALHDAPLFHGDTLDDLDAAIVEAQRKLLSKRTRVPRRTADAIARGLAVDPEDRWASMDQLLNALRHDPGIVSRRLVASCLALATAGAIGYLAATPGDAERSCAVLASAGLREIWGDERARGLAAQLEGSELAYVRDLSSRVPPALDSLAETWIAARTESCAAHRHGAVTTETYELSSTCLDWRRREFEAAVSAIEQNTSGSRVHTARLIASLEAADACLDADVVAARYTTPPAAVADEVVAIREALLELKLRDKLGDSAEVERALIALEERTGATDFLPLIAAHAFALSETQATLGKEDEALTTMRVALDASLRIGDDSRAAAAAASMMLTASSEDAPDQTALAAYGDLARALHARSPAAKVDTRALYHRQLALHSARLGDWKGAYEHFADSLAALRRDLDGQWLAEAHVLVEMANAASLRGMHRESQQLSEQALELHRVHEGLNNPAVATVYERLGSIARDRGDPTAAFTLYSAGLALLERAGDNESDAASSLRRRKAAVHEPLEASASRGDAPIRRATSVPR